MSAYETLDHYDSVQPDSGLPLMNSFGQASLDNQRRLTDSGHPLTFDIKGFG